MKTIFYSSFFMLLTLFASTTAKAQTDKHSAKNYVVLTKKIPQLKPILITAEKLKQEDGTNFGKFEIIICGQEIDGITDSEKIDSFIQKAEKLGVQLVACGFSLHKFNVDPAKVPKHFKIVENGILYNFQLQKKGYLSLSI